MAKKKPEKKKKAASKPSKKTAPKSKLVKKGLGKLVVPKPRNRSLPGMEQVRYAELDGFCEAIASIREQKNNLVSDEKGATAGALKALRKHNKTVYKHAGVELVLVPGDDKLRVRLVKDGGDGEQDVHEGVADDDGSTLNGLDDVPKGAAHETFDE